MPACPCCPGVCAAAPAWASAPNNASFSRMLQPVLHRMDKEIGKAKAGSTRMRIGQEDCLRYVMNISFMQFACMLTKQHYCNSCAAANRHAILQLRGLGALEEKNAGTKVQQSVFMELSGDANQRGPQTLHTLLCKQVSARDDGGWDGDSHPVPGTRDAGGHLGDLHLHLLLGGAVPVANHRQHTPQLLHVVPAPPHVHRDILVACVSSLLLPCKNKNPNPIP